MASTKDNNAAAPDNATSAPVAAPEELTTPKPPDTVKEELTVHQLIDKLHSHTTPSRQDGIDEETEMMQRAFGCDLIQQGGLLLRMPQVIMCSAQVLLHRFYLHRSLRDYNLKHIAMACLFLASKVEESPKSMRDVINVFYHLERRSRPDYKAPPVPIDIHSSKYQKYKGTIIHHERVVLRELGFNLYIEHPHKYLLSFVELLNSGEDVAQKAWNFLNDSYRTMLCVIERPEVLACSAMYAGFRSLKIPMPEHPAWYELFDTTIAEIEKVCGTLCLLYLEAKPQYKDLLRHDSPKKAEGAKKDDIKVQSSATTEDKASGPPKSEGDAASVGAPTKSTEEMMEEAKAEAKARVSEAKAVESQPEKGDDRANRPPKPHARHTSSRKRSQGSSSRHRHDRDKHAHSHSTRVPADKRHRHVHGSTHRAKRRAGPSAEHPAAAASSTTSLVSRSVSHPAFLEKAAARELSDTASMDVEEKANKAEGVDGSQDAAMSDASDNQIDNGSELSGSRSRSRSGSFSSSVGSSAFSRSLSRSSYSSLSPSPVLHRRRRSYHRYDMDLERERDRARVHGSRRLHTHTRPSRRNRERISEREERERRHVGRREAHVSRHDMSIGWGQSRDSIREREHRSREFDRRRDAELRARHDHAYPRRTRRRADDVYSDYSESFSESEMSPVYRHGHHRSRREFERSRHALSRPHSRVLPSRRRESGRSRTHERERPHGHSRRRHATVARSPSVSPVRSASPSLSGSQSPLSQASVSDAASLAGSASPASPLASKRRRVESRRHRSTGKHAHSTAKPQRATEHVSKATESEPAKAAETSAKSDHSDAEK